MPELLLRLVCAFLALLVLTRIMGRKELRQLTFFNFISGIAIGSIAADLIASDTFSLLNGMTALVVWSALTVLFGLVDLHSRKARHLMEGEPIILIHQGEILEKALRRTRLDVNALKAMLRQKNAFAVSKVAYAVLETDGNLSVMKKTANQPAVKSDLNPAAPNVSPMLPTEIISDGHWHRANMNKLNLSREEVLREMENAGLHQVSDVFYAEMEQDGSLYFSRKQ
ncbi:DUF421 domain-containing protein [Salibacterium qingdaonense]|nr:DUF421 domain-containing protein [Salibacterium qingdaonense]